MENTIYVVCEDDGGVGRWTRAYYATREAAERHIARLGGMSPMYVQEAKLSDDDPRLTGNDLLPYAVDLEVYPEAIVETDRLSDLLPYYLQVDDVETRCFSLSLDRWHDQIFRDRVRWFVTGFVLATDRAAAYLQVQQWVNENFAAIQQEYRRYGLQ